MRRTLSLVSLVSLVGCTVAPVQPGVYTYRPPGGIPTAAVQSCHPAADQAATASYDAAQQVGTAGGAYSAGTMLFPAPFVFLALAAGEPERSYQADRNYAYAVSLTRCLRAAGYTIPDPPIPGHHPQPPLPANSVRYQ